MENGTFTSDFTPNATTLKSLETRLEHYRERMDEIRREIAQAGIVRANEEVSTQVSVDD